MHKFIYKRIEIYEADIKAIIFDRLKKFKLPYNVEFDKFIDIMKCMRKQVQKLKWAGIVLILIIGCIHVLDANDSFKDAIYKGWLFYANGVAASFSAFCIYRGNNKWGWNLGFLIAAGSFLGYVASRTIGLPLIPAEPDAWSEPLGVLSLIAEALFIIIFIKKSVDGERS